MTVSSMASTEILACPHCDRLFRLTPTVLGKKIRCRGCQQVFHVPRDTSQVPLKPDMAGPENAALSVLPPIAIAFMQDGRDVRACPACARVFAMKPGFVGKTIRCRLCKASFRILEAGASPGRQEPPCDVASAAQAESSSPPAAAPDRKPVPPAVPPLRPAPAHTLPPTIFEDIGDLLEDLLPGETVMSVVRPREIPQRPKSADLLPVLVMSLAMVGFSVVLALALIQGSGDEGNRMAVRNDPPVNQTFNGGTVHRKGNEPPQCRRRQIQMYSPKKKSRALRRSCAKPSLRSNEMTSTPLTAPFQRQPSTPETIVKPVSVLVDGVYSPAMQGNTAVIGTKLSQMPTKAARTNWTARSS